MMAKDGATMPAPVSPGQKRPVQHWRIAEPHRSFIVFNDDGDMTMEPITADDLLAVNALSTEAVKFWASCAWSSLCEWYFVIGADGIVLANLPGRGLYCRKKSAMFIDEFLNDFPILRAKAKETTDAKS
jgi:hypothetical protein